MFTKLHGGGKFGDGGYKVSGGLHGVGAAVTNALSSFLEAEVRRDGHVWTVRYQRGLPDQPVTRGAALKKGAPTGTTVRWRYDDTIFDDDVRYSYTTIETRLREKAYLVRGLKFVLRWPGKDDQIFYSENGIADYVAEIDAKSERTPAHSKVVYLSSEDHPDPQFAEQAISVEVALQWTAWNGKTDETERALLVRQRDLHRRRRHPCRGPESGADERAEPLRLREREAEAGQEGGVPPQGHLGGADRGGVGQAHRPPVRGADEEQAEQLRGQECRADLRVRRASGSGCATSGSRRTPRPSWPAVSRPATPGWPEGRADSKRKRGVFDDSPLPGKLEDCLDSSPVEEREIFIVEGDSALGTAGDARDKRLPGGPARPGEDPQRPRRQERPDLGEQRDRSDPGRHGRPERSGRQAGDRFAGCARSAGTGRS